VCFVVVNRGEVVVDCVANVVEKLSLFGALNVGHHIWFYFWGSDLEATGGIRAKQISPLRCEMTTKKADNGNSNARVLALRQARGQNDDRWEGGGIDSKFARWLSCSICCIYGEFVV
jgi:hypothetical protein